MLSLMISRAAAGRALVASLCVAWVVLLAGCPGPEYPKCESDDHCAKDKDGNEKSEHCLFGQCQECAKDSHCKGGKTCMQGRCEKSCGNDEQCGNGMICSDKKCAPVQCTSDGTCGSGSSCKDGRCTKSFSADVGAGAGGAGAGGPDKPCERTTRVQFGYNESDLSNDGRAELDHVAKCMAKNPTWKMMIEGHADDRGTTDYNLQLGDQRAKGIRQYLSKLGVDNNRMRVISYGEEKPIESSASEGAWARNRRGELVMQ
jgi:peptidoglycan-associated lipoprotein